MSKAAASSSRGKAAVNGELSSRQKRELLRTGKAPPCHCIKMKQHDFPERSDVLSVKVDNFTSIDEVKRTAEKGGYAGFSVHKNVAQLKGGDNAPRSWKDLLWMGFDYKVDFYLCESTKVWKQTQAAVDEATRVLDGYIDRKTEAVRDEWVIVHALPKDEGGPMGFDNGHDCTDLGDFKVLCAAHPDCMGFAHKPLTKQFFAKKKWSGFDSRTARYYHKGNETWEWYYIKSRGKDPAVTPGEIARATKKVVPKVPAKPKYNTFGLGVMDSVFKKK